MNLHKLVKYDLRCGILRLRYLCVPLFFIIPCLLCARITDSAQISCSWIGYMLFCFMGIEPIEIMDTMEKSQLPILWLISIGGCLFLNLDFMLNDLSNAGQQMIVRSRNRRNWFFSKCIWNVCSCGIYFIIAGIAIGVFVSIKGERLTMTLDPTLFCILYHGVPEVDTLSIGQALAIAVVFPFLSVVSISLLQMTLCLCIKPIFSFLTSILLLLIAVYWDSPFILGNGAMGIRSNIIVRGGIQPVIVATECVVIIFLSVVIGAHIFKNSNILGSRE